MKKLIIVALLSSLAFAQTTVPAVPTTVIIANNQFDPTGTLLAAMSDTQVVPALNTSIVSIDSTASVPLPLVSGPLHTFTSCTSTRRVRREIRDLTSSQRKQFIAAFLQLHKNGNFSDLISIHGDRMTGKLSPVHFTAQFYPWHRLYLKDLEDRLVALGTLWPDFGLPYWDSSIDSQYPHDSVVFTADYLGANDQGPQHTGQIINSGLQGFVFTDPVPHQITRGYQGNISQFVHSSVMESQYKAEELSYSTFAQNIENYPHALVHTLIAGDFVSWNSPNDPLFFLHHAFLDKCWADWQAKGNNVRKFDGMAYNTPLVSLTDLVKDYWQPISYTMDISKLCYAYNTLGQKAVLLSGDVGITIIKPPSKLPDSWFNSSSMPGMTPNRSAIAILIKDTATMTKIINQRSLTLIRHIEVESGCRQLLPLVIVAMLAVLTIV